MGGDDLVEAVRGMLRSGVHLLTLRVPMADGKTINFLENRTEVLERHYTETHVDLTVRVGQRQLDQLRASGARFEEIAAKSQ